jgi:KaiC/GvpD/RAD55 family RecA-like ATPase
MVLSSTKIEKELQTFTNGNIALVLVEFKDYATASLNLITYLTEKKNEHGIYVTVNRPFNSLVNILKKNGADTSKLFFIDCITKKAGGSSERKENCLFISSPSGLTDLGIAINEAINSLKKSKIFLFVDSVSTLLIYNKAENIAKFSHFLSGKLRTKGLDGILFSIESETDKKLISTISQFCDKVIRS